jgi:hypothetical protein
MHLSHAAPVDVLFRVRESVEIYARNSRAVIAEDSVMDASKIVLLLATIASFTAPGLVFGACSHS